MKRTLIELLIILVVMAIAGTAYNHSNRDDPKKFLEWISQAPPCKLDEVVDGNGETPPEPAPFTFIEFDEAMDYYNDGITLFIDARRTRDYEEGHITGAISISFWEADMGRKISELKVNPEVNPEAPIVVYCTKSKDCEDSQLLTDNLIQAGFLDLSVYKGGVPEWAEKAPQFVTVGSEPGEK